MKNNNPKKLKCAIIGLMMSGILLSGCRANSDFVTEQKLDNDTEATSELEQKDSITEAEIRKLFEENLYCMYEVFDLGDLEHGEEAVDGDAIYPVTDEKFTSFADFEEYLLSVYTKEEADMLLYHYPLEDHPKYLEQDGQLCIDLNMSGGKGYFVDWTEFEVVIKTEEEDRCSFLVKGTIEEPAEEPIQEEYIAEGVAVYERGRWVLEKMIY